MPRVEDHGIILTQHVSFSPVDGSYGRKPIVSITKKQVPVICHNQYIYIWGIERYGIQSISH